MAMLPCDGVNLHYTQTGAGPDIVWVPGGDNIGSDWHYQTEAFDGAYRNTTHDPRGAGQTQAPPPPWSISDMAADCARLIEAVCEPPVILVGLSMGALITQQVAIDYPHLLRCAVPMGTGTGFGGGNNYFSNWMVTEVEFRRGGGHLRGDMAVAHYAPFMYPLEALADDDLWPEIRDFVHASYGDRDPDMLVAQWQACIDYNVHDQLPDCQVPMHVFGFSHDLQAPWPGCKQVAERAGNGHFHYFEGLGHLSLVGHRHDEVNAELAKIFAQHS
ncbi:MAG: alpha/beta hydrolase [Alphaproteobacteria bacterium]|jgi:pimeloyl-ACP methyl ester carboxylesterase